MEMVNLPDDDGFGEKVFPTAAQRKEFHRMVVDAFNEAQNIAELEALSDLYAFKINAMSKGSDWDQVVAEDIAIRFEGARCRLFSNQRMFDGSVYE